MKKKNVAIAGASGLIGAYLSKYLRDYEIVKINRKEFLATDKEFAKKYRKAEIIINMSGAPIMKRWTKKNRKEILESRIITTRKLGCIMEFDPGHERMYISASAIGIYNDEDEHTENSIAFGSGFMTEVVKKLEKEANGLESTKTSVCILRTGVVLSSSGGIIARLLPLFRRNLGARIGWGKQYFSWIHIQDLARAIEYIIENKKCGVYNMTAPEYCTNREFTSYLARAVKRPAYLMIPKFIFWLLYGKGATVVTGGQAVVPERLIKEGFQFYFPDIGKALDDIVN